MRLRIFAGPNGSGKSTIIRKLQETKDSSWFGVYVNADDIEKEIRETRKLLLNNISKCIDCESVWQNALRSTIRPKSNLEWKLLTILIDNEIHFTKNIDSYVSAAISEGIRECLLQKKISFSFETVMSDYSKIDLLRRAQDQGYKTYLYFVSTCSPEVNVNRVATRVADGGHDVPEVKIRARYIKSINLLKQAMIFSNRSYIFDNSGNNHQLIAKSKDRKIRLEALDIPVWFNDAVLKR
ncbi:MAG: hypothetical protein RLZZ66_1444 [Pseudomonadota bacterium]